jgi:hypothetical protein
MKRPPKKWLCDKVPKTPEEMDVPELKKLLDICNQMQALCGWNEETYNQQLWIEEAEKVEKLIKEKEMKTKYICIIKLFKNQIFTKISKILSKNAFFKYLFAFTSFHLLSLIFTKFYKLSFKKVYKSVHTDLTASKSLKRSQPSWLSQA